MKVIFLGPPGSGKGTQGELLAQKLNLPRLSVGAILRTALKEKQSEGLQAEEYLRQGLNVPQGLLFKVLKPWFDKNKKGFVVDNLPRSREQLQEFKSFVKKHKIKIDRVFHLYVSENEAVKRLLQRAQERKKRGKSRIDEDEKIVLRRYRVGYLKDIRPILEYFREVGVLEEIDGEKSVKKVHSEILKRIKPIKKLLRQ